MWVPLKANIIKTKRETRLDYGLIIWSRIPDRNTWYWFWVNRWKSGLEIHTVRKEWYCVPKLIFLIEKPDTDLGLNDENLVWKFVQFLRNDIAIDSEDGDKRWRDERLPFLWLRLIFLIFRKEKCVLRFDFGEWFERYMLDLQVCVLSHVCMCVFLAGNVLGHLSNVFSLFSPYDYY